VRGERLPLPAAVESVLYRVAREAFFNSAGTGRLTVRITLLFEQGQVGRPRRGQRLGMSEEQQRTALAGGGHYGVAGMVERLMPWRGAFRFRRRPQGGTEVSATIPLAGLSGETPVVEGDAS